MKITVAILVVVFSFFACIEKKQTQPTQIPIKKNTLAPIYLEDTKTDSSQFSLEDLNYGQLCKKSSIYGAPAENMLKGIPFFYVENVSEYPNWSKDDYESTLRETNGFLHLDTTDVDYEKYWYNNKGLLERYEIRKFGDMLHSEYIFFWNENNLIKQIEINGICSVLPNYKINTVKIDYNNNRVTVYEHNIHNEKTKNLRLIYN